MDFKGKRDRLSGLLPECGLSEVHNSKAHIPEELPAAIVSLAGRKGKTKLMTGYLEQVDTFEVFLVVDETETADEELVLLLENVDEAIQEEFSTEIEEATFYDSLLSSKNVRIASFRVVI